MVHPMRLPYRLKAQGLVRPAQVARSPFLLGEGFCSVRPLGFVLFAFVCCSYFLWCCLVRLFWTCFGVLMGLGMMLKLEPLR